MATAEHLKKELDTYEKHKESLLDREGKYVLIHGDELAGVWDTYADALQAGYDKYGMDPFLVKQIQGIERVHFFSREVCRP